MAFIHGPLIRNVSLSIQKEIITWLIPKMGFFMSTVSAVTITAGYFLASKMGLIILECNIFYWILVVLVIVIIMMIQGLGILLHMNLCVILEIRKDKPNMTKIQRLM
jgi:hypothetical protein